MAPTTEAVLTWAIDIAVEHGLAIWDATILAAAEAGCRMLLSEDMQDGFVVYDRQPVLIPAPQIARRPAWLIATSAPLPPGRAAQKFARQFHHVVHDHTRTRGNVAT